MDDARPKAALLHGSLDMLILRTLIHGPRHGYAIARHLHAASAAFIEVEEGSLYPALHRLERRGLLVAEWGASDANRRAKYYRVTAKGKKRLELETAAWSEMRQAIDSVLNFQPKEA